MTSGQHFTTLPNVMVMQKGDLRLLETEETGLPGLGRVIKPKEYTGNVFVDLSIRGKEGQEYYVPRCIISTKIGLLTVVNLSEKPLR